MQDENERNILVEYTEKGRLLTIAYTCMKFKKNIFSVGL